MANQSDDYKILQRFYFKLLILLSKKTTKRKGGGQKLSILRQHSLWMAPNRSDKEERARLLAISSEGASAWLNAIPMPCHFGLKLSYANAGKMWSLMVAIVLIVMSRLDISQNTLKQIC